MGLQPLSSPRASCPTDLRRGPVCQRSSRWTAGEPWACQACARRGPAERGPNPGSETGLGARSAPRGARGRGAPGQAGAPRRPGGGEAPRGGPRPPPPRRFPNPESSPWGRPGVYFLSAVKATAGRRRLCFLLCSPQAGPRGTALCQAAAGHREASGAETVCCPRPRPVWLRPSGFPNRDRAGTPTGQGRV